MKRILLLIFLLVNLQLTMQDGDLSVSLASISAQSYMYEELPEVEVIGNLRDCPWGCGTRLCKTEMDVHEQNCDLRMVECPSCHQKDTKSRIDNGWHQCGSSSNNEGSNTGGGGGGHSGGGNGHVGGGGYGGSGNNQGGSSSASSKAADYATQHAYSSYVKEKCGHCARAVRLALENAGFDLSSHSRYATNYGPTLIRLGFSEIPLEGYTPEKGDVRVWRPRPKQDPPAGHIDIYNGKNWVSDYIQRGNYPGDSYKQVTYKIYRRNK